MTKYFAIAAGLLLLIGAAELGRAQQQQSGQQSQMDQQSQMGQQQPGQQSGQQPGQQSGQQPGQQQQMGQSTSGAGGQQAIALGEVVPLEGKITKIDKQQRAVTLQGPRGHTVTVKADPKARGFEQLKVGDEVRGQYFQGVIVGAAAGQSEPGVGIENVTVQSRSGQSPSELQMRTVTMQAKVDSVDPAKRTVTLTGPEGRSQTFKLDQNVQLDQIKPGQTINARYIEGVAVELEKK